MVTGALTSRAEILAEVQKCEREIAAIRARQVRLLRQLDTRGVAPRPDRLAADLDLSVRTASDLLETARRTPERSDAMADLEAGNWSFDRAAATAHLIRTGAGPDTLAEAERRDIAGIRRLRSMQVRITRRSERQAHEQRSVRAWASLDSAMGFIQADLTGYDWQVVTSALDDRADHLPRDGAATAQQRRADALVALATDWFGEEAPARRGAGGGPVVTVMVDPTLAGATGGEAGATVLNGPRVGPETLDLIMCTGSVEVLIDQASGKPLSVGPTSQVIPPKVRRYVLARDGGCVIDGCGSTYRLEVHHIRPRSRGGDHDPRNLGALCWWHHHVAIHQRGMRIDPDSPPQRRRLLPKEDGSGRSEWLKVVRPADP